MFANEVGEAIDGFLLWDVEFDGLLADVEVDLAGGTANITEVCICHFTGAVNNAAHDGDAYALEVAGGSAYFLGGFLQVK